jgi:hypothetical protein
MTELESFLDLVRAAPEFIAAAASGNVHCARLEDISYGFDEIYERGD